MKKVVRCLLTVALVAMVSVFTGCEGSSSSSDGDDVSALIGSWLLASITGSNNGTTMTLTSDTGLVSGVFNFMEDNTITGNLSFMGEAESFAGTWAANDGVLTLTDDEGTEQLPYSVSGNSLSITAPDDEIPGETVLLSFTRQ